MGKLIFLDVDGTLCNDAGIIPDSAKEAIQQAAANGHQFFLCTGRSKAEITQEALDLPLSGIIGAGGGYCEVDGEVILHKVFDPEELKRLIGFLEENQIDYYLESNQGLFASEKLKETLTNLTLNGLSADSEEGQARLSKIQWFMDLLIEDQNRIDYADVNKVSFVNHSIPYEKIDDKYKGAFQMMRSTVPAFGPDSGEIGIKDIHKKSAIEAVLKHLGRDKADTMAYGDGHNDVEMFAAVETGVAMGNACDQLLAVADEVTATPDEGGIALSLKKHQLY
ncbi:Cof-type HAD-IIB family hydrolase [Enterococcus sp. 669A]|uniref:Cof-type HAD-IIB family hydrolase n=1 Tax=Candidatus Enterococcus moelleringii TaxID=2815325 RepID=A0ABS3LER0_9ENTE|nr:Cof-type HAD-IIB family hydrolase [Enterococcus sp. 669A]MBO1308114.1 Cof-type HAD-IIB family hydrolase [Enterococcus sp. 669A]